MRRQRGEGRAFTVQLKLVTYNIHRCIGTDRVMPAWNEGVIGMKPGGRRLLRVPAELGYGARGVEDIVPPNSRLIFVIELLELRKQ